MTQLPPPDQDPSSTPQRPRLSRRQRLLRRSLYVINGITVVGGLTVAGVGIWFVRNRLVPIVATSLQRIINRPVDIGEVEGFSLVHLRFGESSIPPTETDTDTIVADTVLVRFNLLEFLANRTLTLDVELIRANAFLEQTEDGAWLDLNITTDPDSRQLIRMDTLYVKDGDLTLQPFPWERLNPDAVPTTDPAPQVVIGNVNGAVAFRDDNTLITFEVEGEPVDGGILAFRGQVDRDEDVMRLVARGNQVRARDVASMVRLPLTVLDGTVSTNLVVNLNLDEPSDVLLNGTASLENVVADIANVPELVTDGDARLVFRDRLIQVEDAQARYADIQTFADGNIHLDDGFDLDLRLPSISVAQIEQTLNTTAPIESSGILTANLEIDGPFREPRFSGAVRNVGVVEVDRVAFETLATRFEQTPNGTNFTEIQAVPVEGGLVTGEGNIQFGESGGLVFDITAENLPTDSFLARYGATLPQNTTIGVLDGNLQIFGPLGDVNAIQAVLNWSAPEGTYPSQGQVRYANRRLVLRDAIAQVAGGTIRAEGEASLVDRTWQSVVNATGIPLNQFSDRLQGFLTGNADLTGTLDNFNLAGIRATGNASFSEGVYLLDRPLDTQFAWLGDRLQINEATAPGFAADGVVELALGQPNPVRAIDLNVQLQDYNLQRLQPFLPPTAQARLAFAGQGDFAGRVTGTGVAPQVAGNLALRDFRVNQFAFEPVLTGDIAFARGQGLSVDVSGGRDRIAAELNERFLPTEFYIQNQNTIAQGQTVDNTLVGTIENLDLAALGYNPLTQPGLRDIRGILNGSFTADIRDLQNPSVIANVAIADPSLGYINADQLSGQVRYQDGVASLREGALLFGQSRYLLSGAYDPLQEVPFTAEIVADQGDIQDLLVTLQLFDVQDFARGLNPPTFATASEVLPNPIDNTGRSLLDQVRRLVELTALEVQQQQAQEDALLPPLSEFEGQFQGAVNLSFSPQQGATATFNLTGENWEWDDYRVDTVRALGEFQNGTLSLLPLQLAVEGGTLEVTGQIGGEQQSAQIVAEDVPIGLVRDFVQLPVDIDGTFDANALIGGSLGNPQAVGAIEIQEGRLRDTPIQSADLRLNYNNARLSFIGNMVIGQIGKEGGFMVEDPDPLRAQGSIPYAFPFMTVEPTSDEITLNVNVRDDGLALLNVFTDRVAWQGGTGSVELAVTGTLSEPEVDGLVVLNDTILTSPLLSEPITNVNGSIDLNRDRLVARSLTGDYNNGRIEIGGYLPIVIPEPVAQATIDEAAAAPDLTDPLPPDAQNYPLTVVLDDLAIVYEDLFEGDVDGRVVISGAALAPLIGGEVEVSDGQLFLRPSEPEEAVQAELASRSVFVPPQLNNLDVVLGNNFRIERNQPDINFVASGTLTMNGPFDALQADGTVQLERGYVNIFVTQFNLARPSEEYPQTAVFQPGEGLDPYLDVRLVAIVPELLRPPTITTSDPFANAEVIDPVISATDYGALQTVRVEAAVEGPASRLFEELTLASEPSRNETEIIALIGGGTLSALEQGDGTLALANLASSALLSDIQNVIVNRLGLSSFRIYPTEVISERSGASALGLAAEVGFDITTNLSASIVQVITTEDLTQFGLRYRISDELSVRGSTTLEGDSRLILEYRSQF